LKSATNRVPQHGHILKVKKDNIIEPQNRIDTRNQKRYKYDPCIQNLRAGSQTSFSERTTIDVVSVKTTKIGKISPHS